MDNGSAFSLSLDAAKGGKLLVDLALTTTLPAGSELDVVATRGVRHRGDGDARSVIVGTAHLIIRGSPITLSLPIDESAWQSDGTTESVVEALSTSLTVCAQFRTGSDGEGSANQGNPQVVDAIGLHGERLGDSPQVVVVRGATEPSSNWLEATAELLFEPAGLIELEEHQGQAVTLSALETSCPR